VRRRLQVPDQVPLANDLVIPGHIGSPSTPGARVAPPEFPHPGPWHTR
jgi:hypothetical protein